MSNKNILIVGEHFSIGGFETYVLSHCEVLKKEGFNVYLVTSKDSDTTLINDLISETLYIDGFPSTNGKKIKEIYFMMKKFIEKNSINYIQIHPHVSAIISAVVAIDLNIPYSYTAHGPLNFSPVYGIVYKTLLFEKVLPNADKIYAVSEELKKVMLNTKSNLSITVLPNILTTFDVKGDSTKKYISIISRLDKDKLYGVLESIKFCKTLIEIEKYKHLSVKIIGDGECFEEVKEYIEGNNKFELVGYSDNVLEYINNSFFVCGMGRVVLESMSLNKPILLVGYDGLKDFVTTENVDELALVNFSGRNKNTTIYEDILNQLSLIYDEKYQLKNWVYKNRSFEILIKEYRQLKDTILLKPMYKDKEWSKLFLEISNQLLEEDILSPHNLIYFIELFNFNRETKIIMSLFEEYNKAREDKNLIELELGMVKQSHLEISHKNLELDNKYKEILKILSSISQRELDLLYKTISDLELESESYKSEILKTNEIINFKNSEIHNLSTKLNNNELIFGELSQKTFELYNSKYFKLVNLIKRLNVHFIKGNIQNKKEFVKWISKKIRKQHYVSYNKIDHPLDQLLRIIEKKDFSKDNSELNELPNNDSISEFQKMYKQKYDYFNQYLQQPNNEYVIKLKNIINNREYKGIVVYPQAVHWEPMQRPQHFLREFSKKGYLCFFCTPSEGEFSVQEYEENLFIVNDEAALLSTIRNKMPIVLCTWMGQKAFIDHLQNKILWYDLLDQLEFFADTDQKTIEAHYSVLDNADIVSYSAEMLHKYVQSRKDAILLSNASNLNDFISSKDYNISKVKIPNKMNRKVVGYFGAVEEWFDASLINELAANNKDLLFVIIGHVSQNVNLAKEDNILLLGKIEYSKLVNYASQFDVAIIPFLVNDLTNCVSPVKYFEYRALNLPVVTTPIHEMKRYQNQYGMYLAETVTQFEQSIRDSLNIDREKLKAESQGFVLENQWLNRVELVEQMITNNIQTLKALANYNTDKHISVMTGTFLGLNGEQFYSGGAERYLIDLFEVAKKMNHELIIYQYGTYPWTRKFKNIEVRSLARGENRMEELSVENIHKYNSNFYEEENGVALLNIYSAFFEAWPRVANPSIGISHGIAWDSTFNEGLTAISFWEQNRRIIEAATIVNKMVSVDTNTTNWFQTIDFETGNKMEYIPNYVDTNIFKPIIKQEERIVISYPRRLYGARGLYLVLEILDEILETYPEVDFHFIGKGFEEDTKHVERKIKKWKSRVKWYSLDPSEMHKAYEITDISLVPTLHSEGTSLSCLEAMATGNAVISTRIGGLTDLIINNFNGLLIEPNSKDLLSAIKKLLENPELMSSIRRNAVEVSKVFSMNQWKEKWTQIIESFVDKSNVEYKKANRTIHIYVKDSNDLKRFIQKIHEYLNNGDLVMIFMENMISKREKHSFGRLQFMTFEEDIFDPGEYVIVSNELQEKFSKNIIEIHEVI
ncbi:MAG: glycosyltransferase [Solibacillus sp.]|uniref:glycosyltransferase n=1 Tax=Solibacillus sp. TaxID=1909654 RepID=UPI003315B9FA